MVPLMLLAMRASNNGSIVGEWCIAMPFGSKKGKKGGTKGHTCVCCCYDKESNNGYRCGTSRLYDGMGWKGNGEWSEMKHELATLKSR